MLQIGVYIQKTPAIITSVSTTGMPEKTYHILHIRVSIKHPRRRDGVSLCCSNERKRKSQFYWLLFNKWTQIHILTNAPMEKRTNMPWKFFLLTALCTCHVQEARKLRHIMKQGCIDKRQFTRQAFPCLHFVKQQIVSLFTVIQRIVHLITHQFVIFQQMMIGAFRKQKR